VSSNVFGLELQRQQEERQYEYDLQGNLMHESVVSLLAEPETKSELVGKEHMNTIFLIERAMYKSKEVKNNQRRRISMMQKLCAVT
ncbi:hypothetical protein, partial [Anaerosporobacter sp.]|uniref:hypothetical protein n=1 Tax=Anaerosporobacter sp. TaxID=1872529 RepID=UPI00286F5F3E